MLNTATIATTHTTTTNTTTTNVAITTTMNTTTTTTTTRLHYEIKSLYIYHEFFIAKITPHVYRATSYQNVLMRVCVPFRGSATFCFRMKLFKQVQRARWERWDLAQFRFVTSSKNSAASSLNDAAVIFVTLHWVRPTLYFLNNIHI
jgi:hypothetical protein